MELLQDQKMVFSAFHKRSGKLKIQKIMQIQHFLMLIYFFTLCSLGLCYRSDKDMTTYNHPDLPDALMNQPLPRIISRGETFRAAIGERVILPCQVKDLGSYVMVWQKGQDVLSAKSIMVTADPRIKLVNHHNLQIRSIKLSDAGDYQCKIHVLGDPIIVIHTLEILVPPKIRPDPPDGNYVVKKGRKVELKCKADGNPEPSITWSRLNNLLPSGEKRRASKTLIIDSVDRHEAGIYVCRAHNGVGVGQAETAEAQINLQVLYPPEIELETDRVHSGENKEAHLTCLIHGNPTPTVRWYKNSMLLEETDTIRMTRRNNRHTLILSSIKSGEDFGNYSCVAENSLGTFKKHIEVHGRPTPAVFRSEPEAGGQSSYELTWTVDSYSPIIEYRLLYRQIQPYHKFDDGHSFLHGGGDWTNVIIPGDATRASSLLFNHRKNYIVKDLRPDAEYECLVQARNKFGWSDASRIFHFFSGKTQPKIRDLEWRVDNGATKEVSSSMGLLIALFTSLDLLVMNLSL